MTRDAEYQAMVENLSATQARCTELLFQCREAEKEKEEALSTARTAMRVLNAVVAELESLRVEIALLRASEGSG